MEQKKIGCLEFLRGDNMPGVAESKRCEKMGNHVLCVRDAIESKCGDDAVRLYLEAIQNFGCHGRDVLGKIPKKCAFIFFEFYSHAFLATLAPSQTTVASTAIPTQAVNTSAVTQQQINTTQEQTTTTTKVTVTSASTQQQTQQVTNATSTTGAD